MNIPPSLHSPLSSLNSPLSTLNSPPSSRNHLANKFSIGLDIGQSEPAIFG